VLQANRRLKDGLQFQANYTLSRAQDNGQTSATFTLNNAPFNAFNQPLENGLSNFDRRHKFAASVVYTTDFKFSDNAVARGILNGWTIAPILNAFSGARYSGNVSGTITPASFGFVPPTPAVAGSFCVPANAADIPTTPSCTTPGGGVNGSGGATRLTALPRNFFKQPNIWYLDFRLSRRFSIGEDMKLEFFGEVFNAFNRTQVTLLNTTMYSISGTTLTFNSGASGFQSVTGADSTLFRERQIQLAVRFQF